MRTARFHIDLAFLLTAFLSLPAAKAGQEAIQVSEIMYHPPSPGEELEFIELKNTGNAWIDMSGWRFTEGVSYTFPQGRFLAPGAYLVVAKDPEALSSRAPHADILGSYQGFLDNAGEPIELVDAEGVRVFRFRYDEDGEWPPEADGEGTSLERVFFQHDPDWGASFRASRVLGGTPGRADSWQGASDLEDDTPPIACRLNEVIVSSEGTTIEFYNPSSEAVSLAGYRLVPDARLELAQDLNGVSVPAGGYAAVGADLSGVTGNVVRRVLVEGSTLRLVDLLEIGNPARLVTYARYPDGTGRVWVRENGSPGEPNPPPPEIQVVFSEIHYHPPGGERSLEWIELCNPSDRPLDLSGWRISGGISYPFPEGVSIAPSRCVVVAADPASFSDRYGFTPLGPFSGSLSDSGERIRIRDPEDNVADDVSYADDGLWPREADGGGKTLVRRNPRLPGSAPGSWRTSAQDGGDPGEESFSEDTATDPVVYRIRNRPAVPRPNEPLTITGWAAGTRPLSSVRVFWRKDGSGSFHQAEASLEETDPLKGRRFSVTLPGQTEGVFEFHVTVTQQGGREGRFPPEGEALFSVDSEPDASDTVTFRIAMRQSDWQELRSRSIWSDEFLPCTLVYRSVPYYLCEMRFRGHNARHHEPKSYRVDIGDHNRFPLAKKIALNAQRHEDQRTGLDLLARTGIPTPRSRFVEVVTDEGRLRSYLQVEYIDDHFIHRIFPREAQQGNLYRGVSRADLSYRGEDPDSYRNYYDKKTNKEEDDWSDLITLCRTLSDSDEFEAHVEEVLDVSEWARWYGVMGILNNEENGLANDRGDDYFIYCDSATGLFLLLPWDLDTVFETFDEPLFRPTLSTIRRFLTWAPAARRYAEAIVEELKTHARPEVIAERLKTVEDFDPDPEEVRKLTTVSRERAAFLDRALPKEISAGTEGYGWGDVLATTYSSVELRGEAPPFLTTRVLVNGKEASYGTTSFQWSRTIRPQAGRNVYTVDLYDETGTLREQKEIVLWRRPVVEVGGTITSDRTWTEEDGPYILSADTTVQEGSELRIEPGTVVFAGEAVRLIVKGVLTVDGTEEKPARITTAERDKMWGGIFVDADASASLRHLAIEGGGNGSPLLQVSGGTLSVVSSTFKDIAGRFLDAEGAQVAISDIAVRDAGGGIRSDGSTLDLSASRFSELGDLAGLSVSAGRLTLTHCFFEKGSVGVRLGGSSRVTGLSVEEFAETGLEVDISGLELHYLFLRGNGTAVSLGADKSVLLDHATVVGSKEAIRLGADSHARFQNGILRQNESTVTGEASGKAEFEYCDLEEAASGEGNMTDDPLFRGGAELPFALTPSSPCAGAASDGSDMGVFPLETAVPSISSLSPGRTTPAGGATITVSGHGFTPQALLLLDGEPSGNAQYVDSHTLRFTAPPHPTGSLSIRVASQAGVSPAAASLTYTEAILRGDANESGVIDLSDAVFILLFLYAEGENPVCTDAADVNRDGKVDIADAVALLSYLFAGGPAPQPQTADC